MMNPRQLHILKPDNPAFHVRFGLLLLSLVAVSIFIYWPGLSGPFVFDDYGNLSPMGDNGGIINIENFLQFVFGNTSGPTGRPVSMLSFLIDGQNWPPNIASFKYTNILIHVLNGLALCWLANLIFRELDMPPQRSALLGVLVGACWLLHPLNSSTTLYVVQRMTQLMTLFAMGALICYLKGRSQLLSQPRPAKVLLCCALFPFGLLSVLSKENGALLLLLFVVFELSLFRDRAGTRFFKLWYRVGVLAPLAIVLLYLLITFPASLAGYELRHFSMLERLLTESRILCIYIGDFLLPNTIDAGIYHDDLVVSQSLLQPLTTLFSVLFLSALLASALFLRQRQPMYFFGVGWFFSMHLLESTYLPLELYFEHRNYISMIGPLIALIWTLHNLAIDHLQESARKIALGMGGLLLATMAWLSWQQALVWGNTAQLVGYSALEKPNSPRSQIAFADFLVENGEPDAAMERWQMAQALLPREITIQLHIWNRGCEHGIQQPITLQQIADLEAAEFYHNDINFQLGELLENIALTRCELPPPATFVAVFDRVDNLPLSDGRRTGFHVLYSNLYVQLRQLNPALMQLNKAFELMPSPRFPIQQAALAASAGNFADSLIFLERARDADQQQSAFVPSAEAEIARMERDFRRLLESQ